MPIDILVVCTSQTRTLSSILLECVVGGGVCGKLPVRLKCLDLKKYHDGNHRHGRRKGNLRLGDNNQNDLTPLQEMWALGVVEGQLVGCVEAEARDILEKG
jgi:hypothetical protein